MLESFLLLLKVIFILFNEKPLVKKEVNAYMFVHIFCSHMDKLHCRIEKKKTMTQKGYMNNTNVRGSKLYIHKNVKERGS